MLKIVCLVERIYVGEVLTHIRLKIHRQTNVLNNNVQSPRSCRGHKSVRQQALKERTLYVACPQSNG